MTSSRSSAAMPQIRFRVAIPFSSSMSKVADSMRWITLRKAGAPAETAVAARA
jgi:hypothetical protein